MRLKHLGKGLPLCLLMAGTTLFVGCKDSDYDFDQIDATLGFGGDGLEIPTSSTETIKLSDILELESDGSVVEDETTHDYVFRRKGGEGNTVNPEIDKITLNERHIETFPVELRLTSAAPSKRRAVSRAAVRAEGDIASFTFDGDKPDDVKSLTSAATSSEVKIKMNFPSGLSSAFSHFDEIRLTMPSFLTVDGIQSSTPCTKDGRVLVFRNVPSSGSLTFSGRITRLDFGKASDEGGSLTVAGDRIKMDGRVHFSATATAKGAAQPGQMTTDMSMGRFAIEEATGRFSPTIALHDLGDINVNGVPDFLKGGNVVVDLYNPQIVLTLSNDMAIGGTVDGVLKATKDGQPTATVKIDNIPIDAAKTSRVCICRTREGVDGYDHVVAVDNLADVLRTIPDHISFTATAKADDSKDASFRLGHRYTVTTEYSVDAPIAFGKDANIEYRDTLDGWNNDLEDIKLAEGAYVSMEANVSSCIPAYLTVKATPVDKNGRQMSADQINVAVEGTVEASSDGTTATQSPLNVKIEQVVDDALKSLDGLILTVSGKADGKSGPVTGITLNAEKHSLTVKDIKIKVVGTVIADLN